MKFLAAYKKVAIFSIGCVLFGFGNFSYASTAADKTENIRKTCEELRQLWIKRNCNTKNIDINASCKQQAALNYDTCLRKLIK